MARQRQDDARGDEREAHEIIALLFAVINRGSRSFEELAAGAGLNPMQARALLFLGEPAPMRAVADELRCDPSYVTEIADELEARGLVQRKAAEDDRRIKLLVLTQQGSDVRSRLREKFASSSPVMAKLSAQERTQLRKILSKMSSD